MRLRLHNRLRINRKNAAGFAKKEAAASLPRPHEPILFPTVASSYGFVGGATGLEVPVGFAVEVGAGFVVAAGLVAGADAAFTG